MIWTPRVTVATIVFQDDRYLLVQENSDGNVVFNQPAGHLEENESLAAAALRETLEETGWRVQLTGIVGISRYKSPLNNLTYLRTTFVAKPLHQDVDQPLDADILSTHWFTYEEMLAHSAQMRSPMVLADVETFRDRQPFPLELLRDF